MNWKLLTKYKIPRFQIHILNRPLERRMKNCKGTILQRAEIESSRRFLELKVKPELIALSILE